MNATKKAASKALPTVAKLFAEPAINASLWASAFAAAQLAPQARKMFLDCPTATECGGIVQGLITQANALLSMMSEREEKKRIADAVLGECFVVVFG